MTLLSAGSSPLAYAIFVVLALLSLGSVATLVHKAKALAKRRERGEAARRDLRELRTWEERRDSQSAYDDSYARTMREFSRWRDQPLTGVQHEALRDWAEAEIASDLGRMGAGMNWLAVSAAVAPLLGLLGTVTGIMSVFLGIHASGASQISAVAPGVAEALLTTAAGLVVAIPAAMGHQILSSRLAAVEEDSAGFAAEAMRRLVEEAEA